MFSKSASIPPKRCPGPPPSEDFRKFIDSIGGAAAVGRACGISSQAVSQWDAIPIDRCPAIEAELGVRCEVLRPDVVWNRGENGELESYLVPVFMPKAKQAQIHKGEVLLAISTELHKFRLQVRDSMRALAPPPAQLEAKEICEPDLLQEIRDQIQLMRSEMRDELRALRRENQAIAAQTRQLVEGR